MMAKGRSQEIHTRMPFVYTTKRPATMLPTIGRSTKQRMDDDSNGIQHHMTRTILKLATKSMLLSPDIVKDVLHDIKMNVNIVFERLKPTTLYTKLKVHTTRLGYLFLR